VTLSVVVCTGPVCGDRRGSGKLIEHLRVRVLARGLEDRVTVAEEVCLGHCLRGPNILVGDQVGGASGQAVLYNHMTVEDLDRVIERHLVGGMAVRALTNLPPTPMLPLSSSSKKRPR